MIGLSRLKRAIADVPTGGMQTGDPKVRLKLCDAQRLDVEFNAIIAERDAALAQLVAVKEGGGTGQSPCAKFCESVATWKDFYLLREHSDRLHVENCDIKRKNAELMAQIESLRCVLNEYKKMRVSAETAINEMIQRDAKHPQQHLRDIQAEAGRAGFIACIKLAYELQHPPGTTHADQYAASVKAGEA